MWTRGPVGPCIRRGRAERRRTRHLPNGRTRQGVSFFPSPGQRADGPTSSLSKRLHCFRPYLGDLPPLLADADGRSTLPVLAPRLKPADVKGRSLMVHAGGDNYADQPDPLGGGGPRVAWGVVK